MNLADGLNPTTHPELDGNLCLEWMAFLEALKTLSPQGCHSNHWTLVERIQLGEDVFGDLDDVVVPTNGNTGPSHTRPVDEDSCLVGWVRKSRG